MDTITIYAPISGVYRAVSAGAEEYLVLAEEPGGNLRREGPDSGERFFPSDPLWWLAFEVPDPPARIVLTGTLGSLEIPQ